MSFLTLNDRQQAPAIPSNGRGRLYLQTSPRFINDSGVDIVLAKNAKYNYLRNSGFWFAQRQAPATATTYFVGATNRTATADGWSIQVPNASMQYRRIDTISSTSVASPYIAPSRFYGEFTKITNAGKMVIGQALEGIDSQDLRGRTVRFQFWAQGVGVSAPSVFRIGMLYFTGSSDTTILTGALSMGLDLSGTLPTGADPPTISSSNFYVMPLSTITPENAVIEGSAATCTVTEGLWRRYGVCFTVPTAATQIMPIIFSNDSLATSAGIALTQASLTTGPEVFKWTTQLGAIELQRCQRCYAKSFPVDTAPAQNAGLTGAVRGYVCIAGAVANVLLSARYPVPIISNSSTLATFYNPSAANAFVRNTTAGTDATATATSGVGRSGLSITCTGLAGWTVSQALAAHYTMDSEI